MARISVRTDGDHVVFEQVDASGETVSTRLDRYGLVALLSQLTRAVNDLPSDPTSEIYGEQPVLRSHSPSFQIGLTDDGEYLLAIRPNPLPPMHFIFDAESLGNLINGLRAAASVPRVTKQKQ